MDNKKLIRFIEDFCSNTDLKLKLVYAEQSSVATIKFEGKIEVNYSIKANSFNLNNKIGESLQIIWNFIQKNNITIFNHPDFFLHSKEKESQYLFAIDSVNIESYTSKLPDVNLEIQLVPCEDGMAISQDSTETLHIEKTLDQLIQDSEHTNYTLATVEDVFGILFKYYNQLFNPDGLKYSSVLIAIPVVLSNKIAYIGNVTGLATGFIHFIVEKLENSKIESIQERLKSLIDKCKENLYQQSVEYFLEKIRVNEVVSKKQAVHSAISAIMGRNMSHNIGSHVIYYLRQHLSGDFKQLQEVLSMIELDDTDTKKVKLKFKGEVLNEIDKVKLELPFLRGLGTFLTYIQERQDFIATISSNHFPAFNKVNVKSFIVDNFLKDLRAKRHKKGSDNTAKDETNILLKYIAKSENTTILFTYNGHSLEDEKLDKNDGTSDLYEKFVDLPGSTLGRQAIYSILENIIRNAAKHGKRKDGSSTLTIDIRIVDKDVDNCCLVIADNNDYQNGLAEKLNGFLMKDIINENTYKLEESHKGLKEIAISAVWLSGQDFAETAKEEIKNYVEVTNGTDKPDTNEEDNKDQKKLTFKITLKKSKSLLIVGNEAIMSNGIEYFAKGKKIDYCSEKDLEATPGNYVRYELIVHVVENDEVEDLEMKAGFRRFFKATKANYDTWVKEMDMLAPYEFFLEKYVKEKYYKGEEFPKILANVDENTSNNSTIDITVTTNTVDTIKSPSLKIVQYPTESIYFDQTNRPPAIVFRRHIADDISKFFICKDKTNAFTQIEPKEASKEQYIQLVANAKDNFLSVENITGDNSSFRIMKNDERNDEWVLRKLEAAKANVLIIDERMYDTNLFYKAGGLTDEALKKIKQVLGNDFVEANVNKSFDYNGDIDSYTNKIREFTNVNRDYYETLGSELNSLSKLKSKIQPLLRERKDEQISYQKSMMNMLKNLTIANYFFDDSKIKDTFETCIGGICVKKEVDGNFNININFGANIYFDYISIHQSIIDKLIEHNKLLSGTNDKEVKTKFSRAFCKELSQQCKKLVIHTGRGKPNYLGNYAAYRSLSDLDYALNEPKEILIDYFKAASYDF